MARKCFHSFHFKPDHWRAATVRGIGAIEGNVPVSDNDWEAITSGSDKDQKIQNWITQQMAGKTCAVVLIGAETANRHWINYEIAKAWNDGIGVVGIDIHGLKNSQQMTSARGANPFDFITHDPTKMPLSSIVKRYNPGGADSKARYDWIATNIANAVEEAIVIRRKY